MSSALDIVANNLSERKRAEADKDDASSQASTQASSSNLKLANNMTSAFQAVQSKKKNSKYTEKEIKEQMKQVLHRIITLVEENPTLFKQWETSQENNSAIAQLAAWASKHTHYTVKEMQIKLTK